MANFYDEKIDGRVWSIPVSEKVIFAMQEKHRVISIARDEDDLQSVRLRVLSDIKPAETAAIFRQALRIIIFICSDDGTSA